jgi:hypothetical protein
VLQDVTHPLWSVAATDHIEIDHWEQFTLSKEYCLKAIDTVEAFFDELLPLLPSQ